MGDKNEYFDPIKPNKKVNYGVVVVRSLQWPGSYTFYTQGRYLNVYLGHGHKYETTTYYPVNPPAVLDDP
jgi:radial spoke head protein 4A